MSIHTTPIADRLNVICDVCGKPRTGGRNQQNHQRCSKIRQARSRERQGK